MFGVLMTINAKDLKTIEKAMKQLRQIKKPNAKEAALLDSIEWGLSMSFRLSQSLLLTNERTQKRKR